MIWTGYIPNSFLIGYETLRVYSKIKTDSIINPLSELFDGFITIVALNRLILSNLDLTFRNNVPIAVWFFDSCTIN